VTVVLVGPTRRRLVKRVAQEGRRRTTTVWRKRRRRTATPVAKARSGTGRRGPGTRTAQGRRRTVATEGRWRARPAAGRHGSTAVKIVAAASDADAIDLSSIGMEAAAGAEALTAVLAIVVVGPLLGHLLGAADVVGSQNAALALEILKQDAAVRGPHIGVFVEHRQRPIVDEILEADVGQRRVVGRAGDKVLVFHGGAV
jgi:hypothetical protein